MMKTIFLLLALSTIASAFPAKLRWNKNPADENVTEYRVWKWTGGTPVLLTNVPADTTLADPKQSAPIEVNGGEILTVTAFNGTFESEHSDQLTVPVKPTKPGAVEVVEIEVSSNLTDWEPVALVPLKTADPARYVRTRIITVTR